jgi:hypothetical protein
MKRRRERNEGRRRKKIKIGRRVGREEYYQIRIKWKKNENNEHQEKSEKNG